MALLVKNGLLVDHDGRRKADIYCENETITRVGENLDALAGEEGREGPVLEVEEGRLSGRDVIEKEPGEGSLVVSLSV